MMQYDIFKGYLQENLIGRLPAKYSEYEVQFQKVQKVNRECDMMSLVRLGEPQKLVVTPSIDLEKVYDAYCESEDLYKTIQDLVGIIENAMEHSAEVSNKLDFNTMKDNVIMQLINTEQNKHLLSVCPSTQYNDLSVVYRWVTDVSDSGVSSAVIKNSMLENMGISKEELHAIAWDNTRLQFPPTIRTMKDVIKSMMMGDGMPEEIADMMMESYPEEPEKMMYIISNSRNIFGAASMLYDECLDEVAEKVGTDLYILPSSIHEVIVVSVDMGEPGELAQMVREVNQGEVSLGERLSNNVYHYDRESKELTIATKGNISIDFEDKKKVIDFPSK